MMEDALVVLRKLLITLPSNELRELEEEEEEEEDDEEEEELEEDEEEVFEAAADLRAEMPLLRMEESQSQTGSVAIIVVVRSMAEARRRIFFIVVYINKG